MPTGRGGGARYLYQITGTDTVVYMYVVDMRIGEDLIPISGMCTATSEVDAKVAALKDAKETNPDAEELILREVQVWN